VSTEQDLRTAIAALLGWTEKLKVDELTPTKGSRGNREVLEVTGGEVRERRLLLAVGTSCWRVVSSARCLEGMTLCFSVHEPAPVVHTLARAVAEQRSRVVWLLDPGIGAEDRIARQAADERHGLEEKRKLAGKNEPARSVIVERLEEFDRHLASAGIARIHRPSATTAVGQLFGGDEVPEAGEMLYRLWSAQPHGSSHVLLSNIGMMDDYLGPARHAVVGYMRAFQSLVEYIGWGGRRTWDTFGSRTHVERLRTH
jgi:hypothetical protein